MCHMSCTILTSRSVVVCFGSRRRPDDGGERQAEVSAPSASLAIAAPRAATQPRAGQRAREQLLGLRAVHRLQAHRRLPTFHVAHGPWPFR